MKKRIILLISLLFVGILIPIVKADSGWDSSYSSYDSGSSWSSSDYDSSSSWDYDYSGSYSSSGTYDDVEAGIITLIIFGTVFFIIIYTIFGSAYKKSSGNHSVYIPNDKTQDEVNKVDPSININELVQYTYNLFVDVQKAWTDFNYDKLRELLSDELFNNYKMQLDTLSLENGKNIMDNFEFVNGSIVAIAKTDLTERVSIKLHVRMKDYVINTITNKVTHGNKDYVMDITYLITLEKSIRSEITNCPNCGGELNDNASQKCPYCDAVLVKGSKDFVMVKKENVGQRYN